MVPIAVLTGTSKMEELEKITPYIIKSLDELGSLL